MDMLKTSILSLNFGLRDLLVRRPTHLYLLVATFFGKDRCHGNRASNAWQILCKFFNISRFFQYLFKLRKYLDINFHIFVYRKSVGAI